MVLRFLLKPLRWEHISAVFIKTGKHTSGHNDPCSVLSIDIELMAVPTGWGLCEGTIRRYLSGNEVAAIIELRPQKRTWC